jgi:hypothetical protein
MACV